MPSNPPSRTSEDRATRFTPVGDERYRVSYLDAVAEGFKILGESEVSAEALAAARANPGPFFAALAHPDPVVTLPNGESVTRPATTILWWVDELQFIGAMHIHHELNSAILAAYGGHLIGATRPSMQRHGHAKRMLLATLPVAAKLGIERILITGRRDNPASLKVIEACGGIYMDEVPIPYARERAFLRRYIIPVPPG